MKKGEMVTRTCGLGERRVWEAVKGRWDNDEATVNAQVRLERGCDELSLRPTSREAGLGGCRVLATTLGYAGNWGREACVFQMAETGESCHRRR
jgi:hypothetical protein